MKLFNIRSIVCLSSFILSLSFSFSQCQGDVNQDENLDILDIVIVVNHILDVELLDGEDFELADMNSDSVIDILDVVDIVNMILSGEELSNCDDGCDDEFA